MGMKKRWILLAATAALALNALPVLASEVMEEASPTGTTTVKGSIEVPESAAEEASDEELPEAAASEEENTETTDEGDVTYIISIPSTADFGTLNRVEDGSTVLHQSVHVTAEQVEGLQEGQCIEVYVRDGNNGTGGFLLYGAEEANRGKELPYSVVLNGGSMEESGVLEENGFLAASFYEAGQSVTLDLQFDQAQLPTENLAEWAGDYTGVLSFYSKLAGAAADN